MENGKWKIKKLFEKYFSARETHETDEKIILMRAFFCEFSVFRGQIL